MIDALIEALPDGVVICDRQGTVKHVNTLALALIAKTRAEVLEYAIGELLGELPRARRAGESPQWTEVLPRGEAGASRLEISVAAFAAAGAGLIAVTVRLVRRGEAAGEARSRLAAIVDSSDDAIIGKRLDGVIVSWNQGAERIFGYTAEEVVGRRLSLLVPADRSDELETILQHVASGRRVEHFETLRQRKDGKIITISATISPVRDENGTIIGASKVARDVTADKVAREAIRNALAQKEVLLQEVHHRVKNNLQVISSLIHLQMRTLPPGAPRLDLEECRGRVEAIAMIHERLYQSQDYAKVRFDEYLTSLAESIFTTCGVAPGQVAFGVDLADLAIPIDKAIPCALIMNELITNALKHAFPGGRRGRLSVSARVDCDAAELRVEDDGAGLPADFKMAGATTFGLELVTTLVEQLEGSLDCSPPPLGGSAFVLTFPIEKQKEAS